MRLNRLHASWIAVPCAIALLAIACPASAYVGPGAGLGLIGSLFAVIGGIFVALLGVILFPIRLLMKRRRKREVAAESDPPTN